jgi:hypothetical protein
MEERVPDEPPAAYRHETRQERLAREQRTRESCCAAGPDGRQLLEYGQLAHHFPHPSHIGATDRAHAYRVRVARSPTGPPNRTHSPITLIRTRFRRRPSNSP